MSMPEIPKEWLDHIDDSGLITDNFHIDEFRCKGDESRFPHERCGCNRSLPIWNESRSLIFFELIQYIREQVGHPITIVSGFRCSNHKLERRRAKHGRVGPHSTGLAADLSFTSNFEEWDERQFDAILAIMSFRQETWDLRGIDIKEWLGFGCENRGAKNRFHIDLATGFIQGRKAKGPVLWTY